MTHVNMNALRSPEPAANPRPAAGSPAPDGRFAAALKHIVRQDAALTVKTGDTLIGLVKSQARQQGQRLTENEAFRQALAVAKLNGIANPDIILPGQQIALGANVGPRPLAAAGSANLTRAAMPGDPDMPASASTPAAVLPSLGNNAVFPVLDKTLERAVERSYLKAAERPAVEQRILGMARRYGFNPDDFARLALIESGMNPQASNGSCHGIIQFCEGPQRGAAAVGYGRNPQAILGMGLLQQLELVDRYFDHVGLQNMGPRVSLDDLYLTVLNPAARSERRRDVPLNIGGPQASALHVDQNTRGPITRNSIVQGLNDVANSLLAPLRTSARSAARLYADATR